MAKLKLRNQETKIDTRIRKLRKIGTILFILGLIIVVPSSFLDIHFPNPFFSQAVKIGLIIVLIATAIGLVICMMELICLIRNKQ